MQPRPDKLRINRLKASTIQPRPLESRIGKREELRILGGDPDWLATQATGILAEIKSLLLHIEAALDAPRDDAPILEDSPPHATAEESIASFVTQGFARAGELEQLIEDLRRLAKPPSSDDQAATASTGDDTAGSPTTAA